jgi:ADP-heptose:LPS heptosyltransferase
MRLPAMQRPDIAVDLDGDPDASRSLLALRPRSLIAFQRDDVPPVVLPGPRYRPDEPEVTRCCRLLEYHGIRPNPFRLELPRPHSIPPGVRGATLIHPGAASPALRWPVDRWAAVASSECADGRQLVVTGSPSERPMACSIARAAGAPERAVHAGRMSLSTLAALVSVAGRVVCSDPGIGQLATAMGTPSVVLFDSTSPLRWGPPPYRPWHRALWPGHDGHSEGTAPDHGLLAIGVTEVLDALADLPSEEIARSVLRWSA